MIRYLCLILSLSFVTFFSIPSFATDKLDATAIMIKVDTRDDGDNRTSDMEMILIDKRGKQRIRKIRSMDKDKGQDSQRIMFFQQPADVKNTGFLTYDYDDANKDDDQWLYLPALRKSKRISTSDKSGSFMGSDFTYSDMTSKELEDYNYSIKKEMKVNDKDVWVIEAIPRSKAVIKETGYTKSLLFIRKDNFVMIRGIHWVKKGKKLKYFDMKGLELIENIWTPTEIHMTSKKGKKILHKTILKFSKIKYNQDLDANLFTLRRLEKGL